MAISDFSPPAFKAAAKTLAIDFLDPDAVKSAVKMTTLAAVALLVWTGKSPREEWVKIGLGFLAIRACHSLSTVHQRAWSRLRPDSPSKTILPLFERADPPIGMYI